MIHKVFDIKKLNINSFNLYLMYGKNEGLQTEIIHKYFISKFESEIKRYDETEFISNSEIIISEILNKSLFDSKKIIIISRVSERIISLVKELINKKISDIIIILKTGILEKKSKLRALFEKDKNLVAVPFYEDNFKDLSSVVMNFLREEHIKISNESINLIINRANGNRASLKNELNKLLNYSYSNNRIDFDVVEKLTNMTENYDANELANNFLKKNKKKISRIFNENNYSSEDCVLILRTLLIKSKRLLEILKRYENNKNIEEIISATKPTIFWKEKDDVRKQIISWNLNDLKMKIYKINEIELLIKNNPNNSLKIVSDFIINC